MLECRICLDDNVRTHQISGSEVQDVYEKLINKKVQEEGRLHYACYICYRQLKNSQKLVMKLQKSGELLRQILPIGSEMHLKSISFLDRLTYGLVNSLVVAEIDSLQIPNNQNILKIEAQTESDSNEVLVKDEPDDDGEFQYTELKLDEEQDIEQDKVVTIENRKENICESNNKQINTNIVANENKSSQIGHDEIYNNQLLVIDDTKSFICNDCGKTYRMKALLIKHISVHKPVNKKSNNTFLKIQQTICHRIGSKSGELKNVSDIYMGHIPFKCQYCNYSTVIKSHLKSHIRIHTDEKPFKCQYCSYTGARNNDLKRHIRTHTGEKPFKCKYCNYTSALSSALKRHIRTHTGEKPFKCQYCNYTCAVSSYLKQHTTTHTKENLFKCQYCSYTCIQNWSLKTHIRTHTGEKPFKCQYCRYTCARNDDLKIHIRTHTGEKPFKCQHCSYTGARNNDLKRHIRTHTGEKPFKCKYCNYSFAISSSLKRHIRTHTGENPFKCHYCSYTSSQSSNLKAHIRTHTGENPFKCQYCSYTCIRKSSIVKHIRSHTGEKP